MYGAGQLALIVDAQLVIGAADTKLRHIWMVGNAEQTNASVVVAGDASEHCRACIGAQIEMFDCRILAGADHLVLAVGHHDQFVDCIVMAVETYGLDAAAAGWRYDGTSHLTVTAGGYDIQAADAVNELCLEYVQAVARFEAVSWPAVRPVPNNDAQIVGAGANEISGTIEAQAINAAPMHAQSIHQLHTLDHLSRAVIALTEAQGRGVPATPSNPIEQVMFAPH